MTLQVNKPLTVAGAPKGAARARNGKGRASRKASSPAASALDPQGSDFTVSRNHNTGLTPPDTRRWTRVLGSYRTPNHLRSVAELGPDEVEVKFGVKVNGGTNWLVAKAATEANFEITLTWNPRAAAGRSTDGE